jgi:hypothetical protein
MIYLVKLITTFFGKRATDHYSSVLEHSEFLLSCLITLIPEPVSTAT